MRKMLEIVAALATKNAKTIQATLKTNKVLHSLMSSPPIEPGTKNSRKDGWFTQAGDCLAPVLASRSESTNGIIQFPEFKS